MATFEIKRSITEEDIPEKMSHKKSMYDPIYRSVETLEKAEGIQIEVEKHHVRQIISQGLKKRFPNRRFHLACRRNKRGSCDLYILRK
jgi:hypothetical protein